MTKDFSVDENETERPDLIYHRTFGKKIRAHASWYRDRNANYHPIDSNLTEINAVDKYVVHGWSPEEPFITKSSKITAFGSCFAAEITKYLHNKNYNVFGKDLNLNSYLIRMGEGLVNSASILGQIEWVLENKEPKNEIWLKNSRLDTDLQNKVKEIIQQTDVFILTYGLSEVWYDKETNESFWNTVPKNLFDPDKHAFKILSPEENHFNILKACQLLKYYNPNCKIIVTLSPIPLAATFRPISCITANVVSKASLRWAIDKILREKIPYDRSLYYFPSYEVIKEFLPKEYEMDLRHPKPESIKFVMETFERNYCCV